MWRRSHQDFRNEIESHLQIEIDRLIEEGLSPQEAEARARQNFGNVTCVAERFYESNRLLWLDNLWKDLTYAARALLRQPMLVAVACLSLALGTGLNTAFFALIDSVLLRPVTVEAPGSLVMLWIGSSNRISEANYHSIREAGIPLTGYRIHDELKFQAGDEPISIAGQEVSLDYFDSLGIPVAHGTRLTGEVLKSNPDAVVVTHRFWREYLHSDFGAIGRQIRLSGKSLTVAGVLPQGMQSIWGEESRHRCISLLVLLWRRVHRTAKRCDTNSLVVSHQESPSSSSATGCLHEPRQSPKHFLLKIETSAAYKSGRSRSTGC